MIVQHLPCLGLAGSVKIVHVVSEREFMRPEFIAKGGVEKRL